MDESDNDESETSDSSVSSDESSVEESGNRKALNDDSGAAKETGHAGLGSMGRQKPGWCMSTHTQTFRGRREQFDMFTLRRPFGCATWAVQLRVAQGSHRAECQELLDQMAVDFGAVAAAGQETRSEDEHVLRRLQRLEERFRGNGVTEGEARNAMRLFERELSKANWTEEKFVKLKRQLAGSEEWSAADIVAESQVRWVEHGKRRQAWFSDICERIATPLGIEFGYSDNGGCCFAGPLSAGAGAALTTVLVCHLAHLDLERAQNTRGGSKISVAQFLQGFVDGALDRKRHLVWEKMFSIEDEEEAARFCQESLQGGFFDEGDDVQAEPGSDGDDLHSMLRNLFSAQRGAPRVSSSRSEEPRQRGGIDIQAGPPCTTSTPTSFNPFSGKAQRLGADPDEAAPAAGQADVAANGGGERSSWALTFASNLEIARSSRQRSREEARKTYHWTFRGQAVKPTKVGTESYSKGLQAGEKRKVQIDGAAGSAKQKFGKGPRLAITR